MRTGAAQANSWRRSAEQSTRPPLPAPRAALSLIQPARDPVPRNMAAACKATFRFTRMRSRARAAGCRFRVARTAPAFRASEGVLLVASRLSSLGIFLLDAGQPPREGA